MPIKPPGQLFLCRNRPLTVNAVHPAADYRFQDAVRDQFAAKEGFVLPAPVPMAMLSLMVGVPA
jgi:hypothetical protein